jgi:hypothetical protein
VKLPPTRCRPRRELDAGRLAATNVSLSLVIVPVTVVSMVATRLAAVDGSTARKPRCTTRNRPVLTTPTLVNRTSSRDRVTSAAMGVGAVPVRMAMGGGWGPDLAGPCAFAVAFLCA